MCRGRPVWQDHWDAFTAPFFKVDLCLHRGTVEKHLAQQYAPAASEVCDGGVMWVMRSEMRNQIPFMNNRGSFFTLIRQMFSGQEESENICMKLIFSRL
jgi:hypothetical protein